MFKRDREKERKIQKERGKECVFKRKREERKERKTRVSASER